MLCGEVAGREFVCPPLDGMRNLKYVWPPLDAVWDIIFSIPGEIKVIVFT